MENKLLAALLSIFIATFLLYNHSIYQGKTPSQLELSQKFMQWMTQNHRIYSSQQEFNYRLSVFKITLDQIEEHNRKYNSGESKFELGLNKFSDMTNQQFEQLYLSESVQVNKILEMTADTCAGPQSRNSTKDKFDWTNVTSTPVRQQGKCPASYAFASAQSVEYIRWISTGVIQPLSPQQLIDCSKDFGNDGCSSGSVPSSFSYYMKFGVGSEKKYPYSQKENTCTYTNTFKVWEVIKCTHVTPNNDKALEAAVLQQPVAVMIDGSTSAFKNYKKGIFSDSKCSTSKVNHGLLVVGFDSESSGFPKREHHFWKAKNSMGTDWGNAGYIDIERTVGEAKAGTCGIYTLAYYPIG